MTAQTMTLQTLKTPDGSTLVVLTAEDYQRLLDAADFASGHAVLANIASGRDELIPASVVKRLVDGENPVRVWREHRGLTAKALAAASGISAAFVSEIESGKKEGSVSALKRLATALGVSIDDIVC